MVHIYYNLASIVKFPNVISLFIGKIEESRDHRQVRYAGNKNHK